MSTRKIQTNMLSFAQQGTKHNTPAAKIDKLNHNDHYSSTIVDMFQNLKSGNHAIQQQHLQQNKESQKQLRNNTQTRHG